jgi:hypothetical protein
MRIALAVVPVRELFEEAEVRRGTEDGVLAIVESRASESDDTQNLHVAKWLSATVRERSGRGNAHSQQFRNAGD